VRVAAVVSDLLIGSRILDVATRAGAELVRVDSPADLPPADHLDLVLIDWGGRSPGWGEQLRAWAAAAPASPRIVLFGPHTDLAAHADAKSHGLGPMLARSKLITDLDSLLYS
jgi:hypothetical protein